MKGIFSPFSRRGLLAYVYSGVSLTKNTLVAGIGSYIVRLSVRDLHGPTDTTWFPCGYDVVSMCTTCGFQVDNTWIQMWTLHDFHVKTTLFPCRHYMVSTWTPCGFYGHHMLPHGHNMVAMWILCGFHVHTM